VTPMLKPSCVLAGMAGLLLLPCLALAKDKSQATLPYDILRAQTVRIVIDPMAGVSLADPQANEVAQRDVETAFMNWGRYQVILDGRSADLLVVVRRGSGKMSTGTIHDPRQGHRPVAVDPTDTGIGVGIQKGPVPPEAGDIPDASQGGAQPESQNLPGRPIGERPAPQIEAGSDVSQDSFVVYRGKTDNPLDASPVWRYLAKDCLKPHKVPAVDAFRKVIDQTEQAAAKQP
jgi:hypothetical protein